MARVYPSPFEAQLNPPDDRCKGAVVDVPAGGDVPPVDRSHHTVEDKGPENDIFPSIFPIMIVVSHFVIVRSDPDLSG